MVKKTFPSHQLRLFFQWEKEKKNRRTNRTETVSTTSTRRTSGSAYQTTEEETSK